jgi:predicted RNA-binding protein with PIN domain
MPYLIDGHNLIGKMGISLEDPEDEAKLVLVLRAYCSRHKRKATVYFDRGLRGRQDSPMAAGVTARFVTSPATADAAIGRHLDQLGRQARNWTVVSSDAAVSQAARRSGARLQQKRSLASWPRRSSASARETGGRPGLLSLRIGKSSSRPAGSRLDFKVGLRN